MADEPEPRRSSRAPLRLLIGSLVLGGGVVALGLLFGGGSATAAEPPVPSPLGGAVASVAGGAGDAVSGVVSSVAPAVEPVRAVVAQVAQPVQSAVAQVPAEPPAPVSAVIAPVAGAADQVVAATPVEPLAAAPVAVAGTPADQLPVVGSLLNERPVSTLTAPVVSAGDSIVAGLAGVVSDRIAPLGAPGGSALGLLGGGSRAGGAAVAASLGVVPVASAASAAVASALPSSLSGFIERAEPLTASAPPAALAATGSPGGVPLGGTDLPSPGAPPGALESSSAGTGAGGAGPGLAALAGMAVPLAFARRGRCVTPPDEDLPSAPLFDHDISPD